ncbi:MAG: hypothetical protein RSE91_05115, partial [Bacilli bacterium]
MEYKKGILISITSILVTLLLVFGISYAWINFSLFGTKNNTLVVGTLTIILDDNLSNGINLTNTYPMNQTNGMKTPSYTFKVTNTGYKANYTINNYQVNVKYIYANGLSAAPSQTIDNLNIINQKYDIES